MTEQRRVAVVTGAARGIGDGIARRLATDGYSVIATDLSFPSEVDFSHATTRQLDVTSEADWTELADYLAAGAGRCDLVVNNAFTIVRKPAHETTADEWNHQLDVCIGQVYRSVRHLGPLLLRGTSTSIVNISSVHARLTDPNHVAYATSKAAIEGATRAVAVEYAPGIRVNAVAPGAILTATWDGVSGEDRARTVTGIPAGYIGQPSDIAAAVAFLASDEAAYITGHTLVVDGGWTLTKSPS